MTVRSRLVPQDSPFTPVSFSNREPNFKGSDTAVKGSLNISAVMRMDCRKARPPTMPNASETTSMALTSRPGLSGCSFFAKPRATANAMPAIRLNTRARMSQAGTE